MEWNPYFKRLIALKSQGLSHGEIAERISIESGEEVTRHAVRHALARAEEEVLTLEDMPAPDRIPYITKYSEYVYGEKKEPKNYAIKSNILKKPDAKVLITSDLHIPFQDEDQLREATSKHMDSDVFLSIADTMDLYSLSRFDKENDIPLVFEIDETLRILEYLSHTFDWVELLEANHERRAFKTIVRQLPSSLIFLADLNILERLATPFPNVIVNKGAWFFQFGSGVFCHPERASSVELKTSVAAYQYFREWEEVYGFRDWNMLFTAHTHQAGVAYTSNAKLIQMPCMARPASYAKNGGFMYKYPQSNGYVVGHMASGHFNVNETREHLFPLTPYV